jgi:hypothetical protein
MEYLNTGAHVASGSFTTLLTAGASTKLLIKTIHATNVTSSDANLDITWTDNSAGQTYYLGKTIVIPQASAFQALDGTFTLDNSDTLQATTSISGSIDISISYMEISNTEG